MSISTETREHTLGPVRAELLQLIAARRPADGPVLAEFATAYLRRISVDTAQSTPVEELYGETVGAFDFASGRGDRPILVRAFNPSADASTATSAPARCWRPTRRTCRSSSTP